MRALVTALLFICIVSCAGSGDISNGKNDTSGPPTGPGGAAGPSGPPSGPSPDTTPPNSVASLTVTRTLQGVALSWSNPANSDFTGVVVRRSTAAVPANANSGTLLYQGSASSVIDPVANNGTTVYYSVFAYDAASNYATATSQSITISPQVLLIPSSGSSYLHYFANALEFNNRLYFLGRNGANIDQPYAFDGVVISDVPKGTSDHANGFFCPIVFNNRIVFSGQSTSSVYKLYYFDGIEIRNLSAGTSDLARGTSCFPPENPIIYNNKLYFGAYSAADVFKLYEYDGTTVRNALSASDWVSSYQYPIVLNNRLYFSGSNGTRQKIYYFDGFIRPVTTGSDWNYFFYSPIAFGTTVIFEGRRNSPDMEDRLYTIPGGTSTVLAPISGDYFADFSMGIVHNGNVYFRGATNTYLRKIYRFNGGVVSGVVSGTVNYASGFEFPISFAGTLYFQGYMTTSGGSPRAFYYDSVSVKQLPTIADYDEGFEHPVAYNNELFFFAFKSLQGKSVYIWNGSQMRRIDKGSSGYKPGGDCYSYPPQVYNGMLVFLGANDNHTTCRLHAYNSQ